MSQPARGERAAPPARKKTLMHRPRPVYFLTGAPPARTRTHLPRPHPLLTAPARTLTQTHRPRPLCFLNVPLPTRADAAPFGLLHGNGDSSGGTRGCGITQHLPLSLQILLRRYQCLLFLWPRVQVAPRSEGTVPFQRNQVVGCFIAGRQFLSCDIRSTYVNVVNTEKTVVPRSRVPVFLRGAT